MASKRDALVEEIRAVRKRTSELQNIAHEQRETILRLTGGEPAEGDLVVVPEATEDLEAEASAAETGRGADAGAFDETEPGTDSLERQVGVTDEV
jgi:hypothetical protein